MEQLEKIERFNRIMAAPAAYLIGTVLSLILPFMDRLPKHPGRLFVGALVLTIAVTISRKVRQHKMDREILESFRLQDNLARILLPESEQEIRGMGVQNPLDFCYVMMSSSHYNEEGKMGEGFYLTSPGIYDQRAELCVKMFGREPEYAGHKDWILSTIAEVKLVCEEPISLWSLDEIRRYVSPEVLERYHVSHEWERMLGGYIREFGKTMVRTEE